MTSEHTPAVGAFGIAHDEEMASLRAQVVARDRELAHLLQVINHDLRAPLRAVVGFSALLQECPADPDPERASYLDHVLGGAREIQELLADLVAYSRVTRRAVRGQRVDAASCFESARVSLRAQIEQAGARIYAAHLPAVMADFEQVSSVWRAILGNALTFCIGSPEIKIYAERIGREVMFEVADNGIGIAKAAHERVFELFARLHARDEYPGRGTGLAFARRIVEHHGGRMWIEAGAVGEGTRFRFTLQAAD